MEFVATHGAIEQCFVEFTVHRHIKCHRTVSLCVTSPSGGTHISQVEGDLQVVPEHFGEVGIHVQHFQQVVSQDLVKVAVGQSPDVSAGFPRPPVQTDGFAKDVVLSCRSHSERKDEHERRVKVSQ